MAAVKLTGVKLDTKLLDKLTAEMKPKAQDIIEKYGLAMANEASKNAPVDTGALRNSIVSESAMLINSTFSPAGVATEKTMTFILQDGVEYGAAVELGHVKRTRGGSEDVAGFVAARPFMLPAVEKYTQAFLNAFNGLFKT